MSDEVKWTKAQRTAIDAKNCDLLVSASAGSGKTAVLIKRIIEHVLDPVDRRDILSMLIVTFTKEAASQLSDKLSKALKEQIAKNPKDKFLRRQLAALPRANISTINSFCFDIVKKNFSSLGLSSSLRIADEAQNTLLMQEVMDSTIESFYTDGKELGIDDFSGFCDNFAQLRDDALSSIFMSIYDKLYSRIEGLDSLLINTEGSCGSEIFNNIWGSEIKRKTLEYLSCAKRGYIHALDIIESDEKLSKAYLTPYKNDLNTVEELLKAAEKGYDEVRNVILSVEFDKLGSARGDAKLLSLKVKPAREFYKSVINKLTPMYYNDSASAVALTDKTVALNRDLHTLLSEFHRRLMLEKNKRGIVSFADCEALSLAILMKDGEPTPAALEYRMKFKEVYIDEYQDVNGVQDAIFRMISAPDTRFMVGDIKQSIYGFRGAEPSLFERYRQEFCDYTDGGSNRGCKVFLSNNFRSAAPILSFANAVSRTCFIRGESSIEYVDGDDLVYSKDDADELPVTLSIVQGVRGNDHEAVFVCDRICEILEAGNSPDDIAVLVRAIGHALPLMDELKKRNIPYQSDIKQSFFDNPEILLALCWMNAIDNTRRDVFVCGIMKSPVYNFTLDELESIRRECPSDTLFNSLKIYTEKHNYEKGIAFTEDIEALRRISRGMSAHSLLWMLLYERGLLNMAVNSKSEREATIARNNLLLLYDYAKSFENGEFKGLHEFLTFITRLMEEDQPPASGDSPESSSNAVRILTIHKSKGLEFPYCFLYATNKSTSTQDMMQKLFFHPELGIAAKISDPSGLTLFDTYIMSALKSRITDENIDEEFRVLYVALTRAKRKLWITAMKKTPDDTLDAVGNVEHILSRGYMTINHSYLAWMLAALPGIPQNVCIVETVDVSSDNYCKSDYVFKPKSEDANNVEINVDRLSANFEFTYPYADSAMIPSKMAVSKLYPEILDDLDTTPLSTVITPRKPHFAREESHNRGAEKGNATHAFMQFCRFDSVEENGVEAELKELTDRSFLSPETAELVDIEAIEKFFTSDIYGQMRSSKRMYREKRFNVSLPASSLTQLMVDSLSDENVLVQGVIDCFFYTDDGEIVLVDYKTDNVKDSKILIDRYRNQLEYYRLSLEVITGRKVKNTYIYSFSLDSCIEVI